MHFICFKLPRVAMYTGCRSIPTPKYGTKFWTKLWIIGRDVLQLLYLEDIVSRPVGIADAEIMLSQLHSVLDKAKDCTRWTSCACHTTCISFTLSST